MDTRISISLGKRQLVDSIWKAANIEGLGTTFPNTEKILENLPVETTRDEVFFVVNMKRAWQFLFGNIDYPNNFAILSQINKICLDGIEYGGGEIRHSPVTIGGTSWVPLYPDEITVKENLKTMVARIENAQTDTERLDGILDVFSYLCRTQIFIDGNKRVAQLFANKMLMQYDLGILSIPVEKCDEFKGLLVDFYETSKNFDLKKFLFNQILPRDRDMVFNVSEISADSYSDFENNVLRSSSGGLYGDDDGTNGDDILSR